MKKYKNAKPINLDNYLEKKSLFIKTKPCRSDPSSIYKNILALWSNNLYQFCNFSVFTAAHREKIENECVILEESTGKVSATVPAVYTEQCTV